MRSSPFPTALRSAVALLLAAAWPPYCPAQTLRSIDERQIADAGIRKLEGKHLTVFTDVQQREDIDQLPEVFDQAVAQWCEYFSLDPQRAANWRVRAMIIANPQQLEAFRRAGLFPDDLPAFPAGFQRANEIWIYLQQGDYYTRHLLLHEGTHAFMVSLVGGTGPPWYAEGMAELLALHRWRDGTLALRHTVRDKNEVPYWGRPKIIRDDVEKREAMTIDAAMAMDFYAFLKVRSYAWAWAVCHFFDSHPKYQDLFRQLRGSVEDASPQFSQAFVTALQDQWPTIAHQWQMFVTEMDYGYDVAAAEPVPALREESDDASVRLVQADRGWQSTGIQVEPGVTYQIDAQGRFQVAKRQTAWLCEPDGITIEYYRGRPLGMLLGAVGRNDQRLSGWLRPVEIGAGGQFQFPEAGELYLRINDSPANWHDNLGSCRVRIAAQ